MMMSPGRTFFRFVLPFPDEPVAAVVSPAGEIDAEKALPAQNSPSLGFVIPRGPEGQGNDAVGADFSGCRHFFFKTFHRSKHQEHVVTEGMIPDVMALTENRRKMRSP